MRRLKCLSLVLLSGVLSLLAPSILLVNNTNATTKITDYRRGLVKTFNFSTLNPNNTYTAQTVNNYVNSNLYSAQVDSQKTFRASSLTLTFENPLSVTFEDEWDLNLYVYVLSDDFGGLDSSLISNVLCPSRGSTGVIIDSCDIEVYDSYSSLTDLVPLSTTQPNELPARGSSRVNSYYIMKLKGHFTQSSQGNSIDLYGSFVAVYNPTIYTLDFDYMFAFSTFRVYKAIPDDDKAAEELNEMNQKDDQDRSDIESQSSNIDSSGESSQQSAENTGTTLLAAFSSFVTAITSASPSNCNIDMDLGNLDLGIVNFCTLSPPPEFQVLGSIFLILFCVPLSIATARKVISLFRSFQG